MMPLAHCSIGTTTNRINLLDETGIHVGEWEPEAGDVDAIFSSSSLGDYRRLKYFREITTDESIPFTVKKSGQDAVIVAMQDLRRICRAAMDYWVESWNDDFVYLAVQASCETNRRYAIIHQAKVPTDNNPFGQPFLQQGDRALMTPVLLLERGPWLDAVPGTATCIEACAPSAYACWPSYLEFEDTGDYVDCASDATIDDLPPNGITAEAWVLADGYGGTNIGRIFEKGQWGVRGWVFGINVGTGLWAQVQYNSTVALSSSGTDEFSADGLWHHVAMSFHPTGYNHNGYIRLWIDGTEVSSYVSYTQATGAYVADAADSLMIGNDAGHNAWWEGRIMGARVMAHPVYRRPFSPTPRCEIPGLWYTAAGTQVARGIWIYEGTGNATGNRATSTGTSGTITGATWGCDCTQNPGRTCDEEDMCSPSYLNFDGVADSGKAQIHGANNLDNMIDDGLDFTFDGWIRSNGYGASNQGNIINKRNDPAYTTGWLLRVHNANGLHFYMYGSASSGYASSGLDEFDPTDGEWHHIVAAKDSDGATTADLYLAIDGVWVASYAARQQKTGNYGSDAAEPLVIGNRFDYARTFDGDIGWCRFSDNLRYTPGVDFTPPARCTLPDPDANTIGIYIYEGAGVQLYDWTGNNDIGYVRGGADWGCDCTTAVGPLTSCDSPAYIANMLKTSSLTDIYHYYDDAGGSDFWSINLLSMPLPYALLPPNLVLGADGVGPMLYFGVDSTFKNEGMFNNIVFDLQQAQSGLTGQWEFYSDLGGVDTWRLLSTYGMGPQDNTNADGLMTGQPLDTAGVKSIHWEQEPFIAGPPFINWQEEFLDIASPGVGAPPVKAYWVRLKITAIGGSPVYPIQQNRHPYTIAWPYIEINDEDVPGDIAASMALKVFNEADHDGSVNDPQLRTSRLICGSRSLSRGADFVGYMNFSDTGNPDFITFTDTGSWAFQYDDKAPTGTSMNWGAVTVATHNVGELTISDGYTNQYYGVYRAFIRASTDASAGDIGIRFYMAFGYSRGSAVYTDWAYNQFSDITELFDLGRLVIPPTSMVQSSEDTEIGFVIQVVNGAAGTQDVTLYDLILIPVDEWAGDFIASPDTFSSDYLSGNRSATPTAWGGFGNYLYIDSITYPKTNLRAIRLVRSTDNFDGIVETIANRPAVLNNNANQRIWFLATQHNLASKKIADIEICHSIELASQARYLSMRGDR
jgi:hypothetical protein